MFPPGTKVIGPLITNKVTISPGPRVLWMVWIGVADELRATEWTPRMFIDVAGDIAEVIPEVEGPAHVSQDRLS